VVLTSADYDDDGYMDLFLGMDWSERGTGSVLAFLGPIAGDYTERDASVQWETSLVDAALGSGVAAGDVDGDGEVDVLMGASGVDDWDGRVFLQFGKAAGTVDVELLPSFRFPAGSSGSAGETVERMDDWGTDGLPEMVVAGPGWLDETGTDVGRVWVFFSDDLF
jgi:hypothetical protein